MKARPAPRGPLLIPFGRRILLAMLRRSLSAHWQLPHLTWWSVYRLRECEGHCLVPRRGDITGWWKF
eukprot:scaffold43781_cov18-Tisochrysis_lutea.AAC.1